ncbi:MAG TPA: DUF2461 domain-containing protein [Ilumatobacteraceae bacterium]|jgi:uncharacterized protein (TIGR02453 family)|nr:DUF2461 domain-containing protein [Ilumatobacteraceae bacterium]
MAFTGFPEEAIRFYEGLIADNSRTYWLANKPVFDRCVKAPMIALLEALDDFGPFHVFRPNKDVRFAKDKTPYKDHIGAYGESEGGAGYYVHFSATGMLAGSGYYHMASDQLDRFRHALDSDKIGGEIVAITDSLAKKGLEFSAIGSLKTAPRGYARDHPRIELLRRKGLVGTRKWEPAKWMQTKAVVQRVREAWEAGAPMNAWLDAHVGPSTLAPDEDALARFNRG